MHAFFLVLLTCCQSARLRPIVFVITLQVFFYLYVYSTFLF